MKINFSLVQIFPETEQHSLSSQKEKKKAYPKSGLSLWGWKAKVSAVWKESIHSLPASSGSPFIKASRAQVSINMPMSLPAEAECLRVLELNTLSPWRRSHGNGLRADPQVHAFVRGPTGLSARSQGKNIFHGLQLKFSVHWSIWFWITKQTFPHSRDTNPISYVYSWCIKTGTEFPLLCLIVFSSLAERNVL